MTLENAIRTLDEVIPPHTHRTVDREHMPIVLAWEAVKVELENRVPVVHCRECKHHVAGYCCRDINGRTNMFRMFDNDFCSYGERKNNGNEDRA